MSPLHRCCCTRGRRIFSPTHLLSSYLCIRISFLSPPDGYCCSGGEGGEGAGGRGGSSLQHTFCQVTYVSVRMFLRSPPHRCCCTKGGRIFSPTHLLSRYLCISADVRMSLVSAVMWAAMRAIMMFHEQLDSVHKPQLLKSVHKPLSVHKSQLLKSVHKPQLLKSVHKPQLLKSVHKPQHLKSVHKPQLQKSVHKPRLLKSVHKPRLLKRKENRSGRLYRDPYRQVKPGQEDNFRGL